MRARLGIVLVAALAAFPADTSETLRARYSRPIPDDHALAGTETFVVRPLIVASVLYGKSGHVCDILIRPERPVYPLQSRKNVIGSDQIAGITDELVPAEVRGKPLSTVVLDVLCAGPDPDRVCSGIAYDYANLNIRHNSGGGREQYAVIRWKRDECHFEPYPHRSSLEEAIP